MGDSVVAMRPDVVQDALAVTVTGKIVARKRHNGRVHTEVRLRAPDEFTKPGVLSIGSDLPIGAVHEIVTVNCVLNGYYGGKQSRVDRNTGEEEIWFPVRHVLDAVDYSNGDGPMRPANRPGSF